MILYSPPTLWGLVRGAAINLLLPFINGLMLGFGELFAHEAAFRLGWGGTKVCIDLADNYWLAQDVVYIMLVFPVLLSSRQESTTLQTNQANK